MGVVGAVLGVDPGTPTTPAVSKQPLTPTAEASTGSGSGNGIWLNRGMVPAAPSSVCLLPPGSAASPAKCGEVCPEALEVLRRRKGP